jgi:hypothetical protein
LWSITVFFLDTYFEYDIDGCKYYNWGALLTIL